MHGRVRPGTRFFLLAMLAPLVAACTTTEPVKPGTAQSQIPVASSNPLPRLLSMPAPVKYVDSALAQPCITAAANKYFLPEKVISAVDSRPGANGGTDVVLKVDLRSAVCSVSAKGGVRSVVDTSPKSADQVAAEAAAANAAAAAPKKVSAPKAAATAN